MKTLTYTLRFNTPAFLGDATQSGRWRTPPIKALLRQWWRVAYAADSGFNVDIATMRLEEGLLFGNAWLDNKFCKSLVRLRLNSWEPGKLKSWDGLDREKVSHLEVKSPVGAQLYLGYGPLKFENGTALKTNAAIQSNESATFSLAVPDAHAAHIERALTLMDRYGTLGGRSRNGWGSFSLLPSPASGRGAGGEGKSYRRNWRDCLQLDWPHAIGKDEKGALIWQTELHDDWKTLMKTLAVIKIRLRTQFVFPHKQPDGEIHDRHWLSYPVTTHKVRAWDRQNLRLPNTLRFKVRPTADGKLVGVIFHVPHKPPGDFHPKPATLERVWEQVHTYLDTPAQKLIRIPE